ncbi:hypothetical protein NP233_g3113 [Leucocoprinus birnbaumii]|uniref:Chitin-binding type-3 domain-containing protein n=1 Tax=Leucocoprinus birnbaumii TaxID=56174 RepID=A0AAD5YYK0_9AGAR|nr:hypothetical protein NP233_g3113 [Leucocoprinus birnbaumii]
MTQCWEPGTQYNYGDIVEYQGQCFQPMYFQSSILSVIWYLGSEYKIIQPHRSQSDWTPDVTPALWGKTQGHHHHDEKQQQNWQQPQPQQQPQQAPSYDYGKQEQGPAQSEHKSWFDEHKKEAEIAGGLAIGAGLLGAAFGAYKHHEHQKEEGQGYEAWANTARARTNDFYQNGPRGPFTWVYTEGKRIPQGAVSTGREKDWTLYIARSWIDGAVMPGKASDVFKKGAVIGYKEKEHHVDKYEVLLGDMSRLKWVQFGNRINLDALGAQPVEGGYENDGTPLYIVKAYHKDAWHPGKASVKFEGAFIPYDDKEKLIREYQVLCYA